MKCALLVEVIILLLLLLKKLLYESSCFKKKVPSFVINQVVNKPSIVSQLLSVFWLVSFFPVS